MKHEKCYRWTYPKYITVLRKGGGEYFFPPSMAELARCSDFKYCDTVPRHKRGSNCCYWVSTDLAESGQNASQKPCFAMGWNTFFEKVTSITNL